MRTRWEMFDVSRYKRASGVAVLLGIFAAGLSACAQTAPVLPQTKVAVVDATACDVLARPDEFDGRTVRITGTVQTGLDDFLLRADGCKTIRRSDAPYAIWIDLPEGTRSKAGPAMRITYALAGVPAAPVPPVRLERNRDFKLFEEALAEPLRRPGMCLGCQRNTVTATVVGHVDALAATEWKRTGRRVSSIRGFGHLDHYRVRLLLQSVSDVTPHPVDYSAAEAALQQASPVFFKGGDAPRSLYALAEAFPNGSAVYGQMRRAAFAFGTQKDPDGVVLRPGVPGEVHVAELSAGPVASSDGLVAYVDYDPARLQGDAFIRALAIAGCELADLREGPANPNLFELDAHGIETAVLTAIVSRQRTLTLPGGHTVWDLAWNEATRTKQSGGQTLQYLRYWKADVFSRPPAVAASTAEGGLSQ